MQVMFKGIFQDHDTVCVPQAYRMGIKFLELLTFWD